MEETGPAPATKKVSPSMVYIQQVVFWKMKETGPAPADAKKVCHKSGDSLIIFHAPTLQWVGPLLII